MQYMAFDSHKQDTLAQVADTAGSKTREVRIGHERGALQQFWADCEPVAPPESGTVL
jgi:hypothetical protein